jgi:hypothetical protein
MKYCTSKQVNIKTIEHNINLHRFKFGLVGAMVFNATFNNISVISWRSVLLVEEIEGPQENHRLVASH